MSRGRVLIIESDEWASAVLGKFLREAGYEVWIEGEARSGFDRVRELRPACILCGVNLPDIDGFWVARRVRAETSEVGATPFLFLTDADDVEGRLQGLNVGADLFLSKPFRNEEVVAQVSAMIDMAHRLKTASMIPGSEAPPSSAGATALQGDLAEMSISTVLSLLELERRSGRLRVRGELGTSAVLELFEGAVVRTELEGKDADAVTLIRELLRWKKGSFRFRSKPIAERERRLSLSSLLLDAVRLDDEVRRK